MGYRNAQDIFPENLLRQIQRYVSGETIYVPARKKKKSWGESSGYQQYMQERNAEIRAAFLAGESLEALADRYALSFDTVKKIVYSRKEVRMLKYSPTLSSARDYAAAEKLDAWLHLYLSEDGRNIPFSDGLKLFDRYYISPAQFPLALFRRCTGPEPDMRYRVDAAWWAQKVAELEKAVQAGVDLPPLIVHYVDGGFELNDGNHRHQAYENLGMETAWAVVWITEKAELDDFLTKYGNFVKDCTIIRR